MRVYAKGAATLVGSMAALNVAMVIWWAQPINIDALAHGAWRMAHGARLRPSVASTVVSAELLALTVVSYAMSMTVRRLAARQLSLWAALAVILADVACIFTRDYAALLACRVAAGALEGLVMVAANVSLADADNPDRAYALQNLSNVVSCGLFMAILPLASEPYAQRGVYGAHGLAVGLLLLPLLGLPRELELCKADPTPVSRRSARSLLAAMLVWTTVAGLPWATLVEIGQRTGMSIHLIALTASLTGIGGVGGGLLANAWKADSRGAQRTGLAVMIASGAAMIWEFNPAVFAAVVYIGALFFVLPAMLGMSAALDPGGGLPAAMGAIYILSGSTSVVLSGVILEHYGFAGMFLALLAGCLASAVVVGPRARTRAGRSLATS